MKLLLSFKLIANGFFGFDLAFVEAMLFLFEFILPYEDT